MKELIEKLRDAAGKDMDIATAIRAEAPEQSYHFFRREELMNKAAEELKRNIPQKIDVEGGGYNWWYVCPECHGAIDSKDHFCKHCGQAVEE